MKWLVTPRTGPPVTPASRYAGHPKTRGETRRVAPYSQLPAVFPRSLRMFSLLARVFLPESI